VFQFEYEILNFNFPLKVFAQVGAYMSAVKCMQCMYVGRKVWNRDGRVASTFLGLPDVNIGNVTVRITKGKI
jgi:hypothetical protein